MTAAVQVSLTPLHAPMPHALTAASEKRQGTKSRVVRGLAVQQTLWRFDPSGAVDVGHVPIWRARCRMRFLGRDVGRAVARPPLEHGTAAVGMPIAAVAASLVVAGP